MSQGVEYFRGRALGPEFIPSYCQKRKREMELKRDKNF